MTDPRMECLTSAICIGSGVLSFLNFIHALLGLTAVLTGAILGVHGVWCLWKGRRVPSHNYHHTDHGEGPTT